MNILPPAVNDVAEFSESDDETVQGRNWDADGQHATAAEHIGNLLARIDHATGRVGASPTSDEDEGGSRADGQIWPGHGDTARWQVAARTH